MPREFLKCAIWFLALYCVLGGQSLRAAVLHVYAAASLKEALQEIATNYASHSGDRIVFNFGASSLLARQIEEGAPADIFYSADEAKMQALADKDRILVSTRKSRVSNTLVLVTEKESGLRIQSAQDLAETRIQRVALADPKAVPAGIYARTYLERIGVWTLVAPKVIPTDNVRAALAAVESGNVEVGIVYKTDAAISTKVKIAHEIPRDETPEIRYSVAVVKESKNLTAAGRFAEYLNSAEAMKVFVKFGFIHRE